MIEKFKLKPIPFGDKRIQEVINENQLVVGPHVFLFEKQLCKLFGFGYCDTVVNGFSALFLAIKSLKIETGKIIVPLISTCQAIPNAVLASGLEVIFCPIDSSHLSLCESSLEKLLKDSSIKAIIAPSHFGIPAPIEKYKRYGLPVIEDACQAFNTRIRIKSCADIMVLSFYPTKEFNCIEGGAILHNSKSYKSVIDDIKYYNNQMSFDGIVRYNLRLPNLNAAIGLVKMDTLYQDLSDLRQILDSYIEGITNKSVFVKAQLENDVIPWRLLIHVDNEEKRLGFLKQKIKAQFELNSLCLDILPCNDDSWFRKLQSIPFYGKLDKADQSLIINYLNTWN